MKSWFFGCLAVAVIVAGIALGLWQMQRLAGKEHLLAAIAQAYDGPVSPLTPAQLRPVQADETSFARGLVSGLVHPETAFLVAPRLQDGRVGSHLYVLFKPDAGPDIWLNAGFVADDYVPTHLRPRRVDNITVTLRAAPVDGVARPMIVSGVGRFAWGAPVPLTRAVLMPKADARAAMLWPEGVNVMEDEGVASIDMTRPHPPNNHLFYATFWISMSVLAAFFMGLNLSQGRRRVWRLRRRRHILPA